MTSNQNKILKLAKILAKIDCDGIHNTISVETTWRDISQKTREVYKKRAEYIIKEMNTDI